MNLLNAVPPNFTDLGWQLAALIFFWMFVVGAVLILFGVIVLKTVHKRSFYDDRPIRWIAGIGALLGLSLALVGGGVDVGYRILGVEYMKNYQVEGKVLSVSDKFVDGSGDLSYGQFVITLDTVDVPLVIEDAKSTTLLGKQVSVTCYLGFNYQAHDDYYCKIRDYDLVTQ